MADEAETKSLYQAVKVARSFARTSSRFGRMYIASEAAIAIAAVAFSMLPRVANYPTHFFALSGAYFAYVALGELQFELWIKQRQVPNRDVVMIGYRTISRLAMFLVFCSALAILNSGATNANP
jgi:hypothetical protein